MKNIKLLLVTLFIFSSQLIFSQVEDNDIESFGNGFGAFKIDIRNIEDKAAIFVGGGGGFLINNFHIGVFFTGLTNSFSKRDTANVSYKLAYSYGGLWLGYAFRTSKPLHLFSDLRLSIGDTRLINTNWQRMSNGIVLGINPSLGVQYSISEILKICGGIQYHYSYFPNEPSFYDKKAFSSPGIFIAAKLGMFRY